MDAVISALLCESSAAFFATIFEKKNIVSIIQLWLSRAQVIALVENIFYSLYDMKILGFYPVLIVK